MVGHILKVEPIRFANGFDVGWGGKGKIQTPPNIFAKATGRMDCLLAEKGKTKGRKGLVTETGTQLETW